MWDRMPALCDSIPIMTFLPRRVNELFRRCVQISEPTLHSSSSSLSMVPITMIVSLTRVLQTVFIMSVVLRSAEFA